MSSVIYCFKVVCLELHTGERWRDAGRGPRRTLPSFPRPFISDAAGCDERSCIHADLTNSNLTGVGTFGQVFSLSSEPYNGNSTQCLQDY